MLLDVVHVKKNIVLIKPLGQVLSDPSAIIDEIKQFISSKNSCHNIILDLTELSFLNCIKVGVLAATYHFIEFINGKLYLVVCDKQVQKSIETLNLSNAVVICNDHKLSLENIA